MNISLGTICPRTLSATICIGQQHLIGSLKERRPVCTGYLLVFDLNDGTPLLTLLEEIKDSVRQPVQYLPSGRA